LYERKAIIYPSDFEMYCAVWNFGKNTDITSENALTSCSRNMCAQAGNCTSVRQTDAFPTASLDMARRLTSQVKSVRSCSTTIARWIRTERSGVL